MFPPEAGFYQPEVLPPQPAPLTPQLLFIKQKVRHTFLRHCSLLCSALQVLPALLKHPFIRPFLQPVNARALNIFPHYFKVRFHSFKSNSASQ